MSFLMIFRTFGFCSSESLPLKYDLLSSKHSEESVQVISISGMADSTIIRWRILISILVWDSTEMLVGETR